MQSNGPERDCFSLVITEWEVGWSVDIIGEIVVDTVYLERKRIGTVRLNKHQGEKYSDISETI